MSDCISIGINGFGRIGRTLFRLLHGHPKIKVVAINDQAPGDILAHLLTFDSIHGRFLEQVTHTAGHLNAAGQRIRLTHHTALDRLDWHGVDIVVEATGRYKSKQDLQWHLAAGAKKVILSAPPLTDDIKTIVMGVNQSLVHQDDTIISNASCTTNNAAPMLKVVHELYGVTQASISTVHSFTTDQNLHDQTHLDFRRARAATASIIPTTTGAAKALTKVFPELADAIGGCGIRVPIANGSLTDMTLNVSKKVNREELNLAFKTAAQGGLKGILEYSEQPLVSVDIIGNTHSCVFDAEMTSVIGHMVKIIGWYDNETGYSSRIIDLIDHLSRK
jgi:glyceraldehyde 3-phosphate dehydrogenase